MKIVTVRRICQGFFLVLFLWFCVAMNLGDRWWQLRGWPVNWLLQLDPLVGLGTLLATRTLYRGLLWGLATVVLTILLGRFFCGWVCPFGTCHQLVGYLGHRKKKAALLAEVNRYRPGQTVKYWILVILMSGAAVDLVGCLLVLPRHEPRIFWFVIAAAVLGVAVLAGLKLMTDLKKTGLVIALSMAVWGIFGWIFQAGPITAASLQTGLLDPIPLFHRSVNLVLLPLIDGGIRVLSPQPRYYAGAGLIGLVFLSAVLLNLHIPRFYCRFICPLGALFGVLSPYALWRVGKSRPECRNCHICETHCEGGCEPSLRIRTAECVLCMNCLNECRHDLMGYGTVPSATGEKAIADVSRRGFVLSMVSGFTAIPVLRVNGSLGPGWHPQTVRPPGSLPETDFLHRCIKCGQCMRICPTNVIQPAGFSAGVEGLWTPVLDFRIGTSGCQLNCIACGHLCPTAAIRPISLAEKLGTGVYTDKGPIRIGTAFVDRGRCLPWAMGIPCIVCEENCPVSPKAITTLKYFSAIETPTLTALNADASNIQFSGDVLDANRYGTGDYFVRIRGGGDGTYLRVLTNSRRGVTISNERPFDPIPESGTGVELLIRLQQPVVDPKRCIGCGVCQHECPVKGKRAIRVTADNETRSREHALVL